VSETATLIDTTRLCPKCQGQGRVKGKTVTRILKNGQWSVTTYTRKCRRCKGTGLIPAPPAATPSGEEE